MHLACTPGRPVYTTPGGRGSEKKENKHTENPTSQGRGCTAWRKRWGQGQVGSAPRGAGQTGGSWSRHFRALACASPWGLTARRARWPRHLSTETQGHLAPDPAAARPLPPLRSPPLQPPSPPPHAISRSPRISIVSKRWAVSEEGGGEGERRSLGARCPCPPGGHGQLAASSLRAGPDASLGSQMDA